MYSQLKEAITKSDNDHMIEELVKQLKVRGGHDQLIMLLTGPGGIVMITAAKVACRFYFELCHDVGTLWNNATFLFTAYTGPLQSAMAANGLTIYKAAYIFLRKVLTKEDK